MKKISIAIALLFTFSNYSMDFGDILKPIIAVIKSENIPATLQEVAKKEADAALAPKKQPSKPKQNSPAKPRPSTVQKDFFRACDLYDRRRYEKAFKLFSSLAEQDENKRYAAYAQIKTASMMITGEGVEHRKTKEGIKRLRRVARQTEYPRAQAEAESLLGACYYYGVGYKKNRKKAEKHLGRAFNQQHNKMAYYDAAYLLACLALSGKRNSPAMNDAWQKYSIVAQQKIDESLQRKAQGQMGRMVLFGNHEGDKRKACKDLIRALPDFITR